MTSPSKRGSAGASSASRNARATSRAQTCRAFETYNAAFTKSIRNGEKQAATLTYYKEHPGELARVITQSEQTLHNITGALPDYC